MKKLLTSLLLLIPIFSISQTCDLEFLGYDKITQQVTVVIHNGENCGCNEYTQQDGNTCNEASSSAVGNNESVTHLVFGLHYDDFDYEPNCTASTDFHPGWNFVTAGLGWEYFTGDTANFQLDPPFGWDCMLNNPVEGICWEMVVWQINLSQTVDIVDFPNDFWTDTCGTCADQTQMYPDINLSDNSLIWCPGTNPPPPLYPGCMDPLAENYDETANFDDGSCIDPPIYGCTDPTACNYTCLNPPAEVDDGSCVYCDTPNGEELCDECQGEGYFAWYSNIFDCNDGPDLTPVSMVITDQFCLSDNTTHVFQYQLTATNVGTEDVGEFCVQTSLNPSAWNCSNLVDIDPGASNVQWGTFQASWVSNQPATVTLGFVEGLNGELETVTDNNTLTFNMPEFIECIVVSGCTDVCAINYDPGAVEDDGSCEYEILIDTVYVELLDTLYIELPPDTVTVTEYDTTYIEIIDTLYIELPPDTVTVTETEFIFITDTIYETDIIFITDTLYITLIDTIVEYQFIEIDCATGLPCEENPGFNDCEPLTVYIPNTFTPNNDGYNDAWEIVLFPECWAEVDAKVYNRWGGVIWESTDPYNLIWEGGFNNGDYYVPDGTYYWTFTGRKANSAYIEQLEGHVTIFR
jgi:gliding motility-associated-like protein